MKIELCDRIRYVFDKWRIRYVFDKWHKEQIVLTHLTECLLLNSKAHSRFCTSHRELPRTKRILIFPRFSLLRGVTQTAAAADRPVRQ